jgi:Family of unknown function (DUF5412)
MEIASTKPSRRNTVLAIFGIIICLLVLICGSCYLFVSVIANQLYGNEIFQEVYSPDNQYKAIAFQRDCGATTGFSTRVSILPATKSLNNSDENIFSMDGHPDWTEVKVSWENNHSVTITYLDGFKIFYKNDYYRHWFQVIHIQYQVVPR